MSDTTNVYLPLQKEELKRLRRLHKDSPETLTLIDKALDAKKPQYGPGRIKDEPMSEMVKLLEDLLPTLTPEQLVQFDKRITASLDVLKAFRKDLIEAAKKVKEAAAATTPAAAPAEAPAS